MKIGIIGTGTIAAAVVKGVAEDGHTITVSERNAATAARLSKTFSAVSVAPNQAVLDRSDVVFIGLMAEAAPEVLGKLSFRAEHRVVSLMASASLADVAGMVAPARAEAVMIPFPGIAQGGSPIMAFGNVDVLRMLFGARNTIFELASEAELAAYMCAQAVLSPAVRMVADAADWLGNRVDNGQHAEAFLRMLVGSSLLASDCAPLLAALDTPGGYNQRLREHMVEAGISVALAGELDKLENGE
jgi:pyrroline-5-carboxylate reductase